MIERRQPLHRLNPEPEDELWLITFADMSVLLMCFFVLLFSISAPKENELKIISQSLREEGFFKDAIPTEDPYEKVKKQLAMALSASGFEQFISASSTPNGIDIELSSAAFFMPGSAKFTPQALPMLDLIAKQIAPIATAEVLIQVEGHTDDTPIQSEMFPSNWELSAARASNVVRFLVARKFPQEKMEVIGRADTMPKAPNRDATGNPIPANQDLNRRVVVHLARGEDR